MLLPNDSCRSIARRGSAALPGGICRRAADGADWLSLEPHLKAGLARAFGVYREAPDGSPHDEDEESLRDLELQAAKRGAGVWAATDWEALPAERREQRRDEADLHLATKTPSLPADTTIDLNTAARDDLMKLPGIGEMLANRIIESRPFRSVDQLGKVPGIGPVTVERIRPHVTVASQ